jgi:hypothetical protein
MDFNVLLSTGLHLSRALLDSQEFPISTESSLALLSAEAAFYTTNNNFALSIAFYDHVINKQ